MIIVDIGSFLAHPNFEDRPNPIRLRLAYEPESMEIEAAWIETKPSIWIVLPVDAVWLLVGGRPDPRATERAEHIEYLDRLAAAESECAA